MFLLRKCVFSFFPLYNLTPRKIHHPKRCKKTHLFRVSTGMWWGRRDALCRICAAALWPGGEVAGGAKEIAVSGGLTER